MECERRRVSLPYRRGCGRGQLLLEAAADCYRGVTSGFLVALAASVEGAPRVRTSRAVTHGVSLLVTSIINLLGPGRLLESESQRVGSFANFARNRSRNRNQILRNRPTATPLIQADSWKQNRRIRFRPRNRSWNRSRILRNPPGPRLVLQSARTGFSRFCIVCCVFWCCGDEISQGKITGECSRLL